jgi:uncharacterized surface protein with fasciclin (FAS1) repeats
MKNNNLKNLVVLITLGTCPLGLAAEKMTTTTKTVESATTTAEAAPAAGTLTAAIDDSQSFSILKKALSATGLDATLADKKGVYTIFAPTDEAFGKLPNGTLTKLMLPQNKEKLRSLLLYHVVAGKMLSSELKSGKVTTMNGEKVKIDVDGEMIKVGDTKVFSANVMASNGVMHSIGRVLVPKSLDGFVKLKD